MKDDENTAARCFPLFFKLKGMKILVAGGGEVAERKVKQLLKFGGVITVVSPELTQPLKELAEAGKIDWLKREYRRPEAAGYSLVIATTGNPEVNRAIYADAASNNIPLNVVDQPGLCTVFFPSIISRGDFTIALGSSGKAPFFTREMRQRLDKLLPDDLARKAEIAGIFRQFVMDKRGEEVVKKNLYHRFLSAMDTEADKWLADLPAARAEWDEWLGGDDE